MAMRKHVGQSREAETGLASAEVIQFGERDERAGVESRM